MRSLVLCSLLISPAVGLAAEGGAAPNPFLIQAKVYYQGGEYEKCIQRAEQATRLQSTRSELVELELYAGLCNFYLGNQRQAGDHFEIALRLDPTTKLPPFTSPKAVDFFEQLAARVAPPPSAPVVEAPATPGPGKAADEGSPSRADRPQATALGASKPAPAPPAYLPDAAIARAGPSLTVPLVLGGVGVAAAGAFTYFGLSSRSLAEEARQATFESDARASHQQAQQAALLANIGLGVAAAAFGGAVGTYLLGQ